MTILHHLKNHSYSSKNYSAWHLEVNIEAVADDYGGAYQI
jgi:hypothetical protein